MGDLIGIVVALGIVAYNLWVTVLIVKADDFEPGQKAGQLAFVWLVPIVGATMVRNVIKPDTRVYRGGDESDG